MFIVVPSAEEEEAAAAAAATGEVSAHASSRPSATGMEAIAVGCVAREVGEAGYDMSEGAGVGINSSGGGGSGGGGGVDGGGGGGRGSREGDPGGGRVEEGATTLGGVHIKWTAEDEERTGDKMGNATPAPVVLGPTVGGLSCHPLSPSSFRR